MLAADGEANYLIAERVGVSRPTVNLWRARYAEHGIAGLADEPRPGRPREVDALRAAARDRGSLAGAIFHSDHGSVYASKAYAALCEALQVTQSMGAVGTSADNSLAESVNAALKRELLEGAAAFPDQATAHRAVFRWASRYNTRRRHSAIGHITPNNYEKAHETATSATLAEAA